MKIISNSSPLIIFERIKKPELLEKLFEKILIPQAVSEEVFKGKINKIYPCVNVVKIKQSLASFVLESNLSIGESEAIILYLEENADLLLLDDLKARKIAEARGIKIIGVLGILILAKEKKLIDKVKPLLDKIIRLDFRISKPLYEYVLTLSVEK